MANSTGQVQTRSPAELQAQAALERERSSQNDQMVKNVAKNVLGHLFDTQTQQMDSLAVKKFSEEDLVVEGSETKYAASLDFLQDSAVSSLNQQFGFNIDATLIPSFPVKTSATIGVDRKQTETSQSNSVFCAVACVRIDRCRFRELPERELPAAMSLYSGILKSATVFAGYRIVLEIVAHQEGSEKSSNVNLKADGSTIQTLVGAGANINIKSESFAGKTIAQIRIKEITGIGGYIVPQLDIAATDFQKIQKLFEDIRKDFLLNYFSIGERHIVTNPLIDLAPLRIALATDAHLSSLIPVQTPSIMPPLPTQRDAEYFQDLAREIILSLSEEDRLILSRSLKKSGTGYVDLGNMLYASQIAFAHLLQLGEHEGPFFLILGDETSSRRLLSAELTEGQRGVANFYLEERFRSNSNIEAAPDGIRVLKNVLETPILARGLSPEFQICQGVATRFVIERFLPSKILIPLPNYFFHDLDSGPGRRSGSFRPLHSYDSFSYDTSASALLNSLRRVLFNYRTVGKYIFFVLPPHENQRRKEVLLETIEKRINDLSNRKNAIMPLSLRLIASVGGVWSTLMGMAYRQAITVPEEMVDIEEEIQALIFVRDHLWFPSESATPSSTVQAVEDNKSLVLKLMDTSLKPRSSPLTYEDFDPDSTTINGLPEFRAALTTSLRYFRHIQQLVENKESQFSTHKTLCESVDTVIKLLKKPDGSGINQAEAKKFLDDTTAHLIDQLTQTLLDKTSMISKNESEISTKSAEIDQLNNNTTATELKLTPDAPISARPIWRIPPFGATYTFATDYKISKCEFKEEKDRFSISEETFLSTKKVVFTPKWHGYEQDLRASVVVWIEKKDHPSTKVDIANLQETITQRKKQNTSIQQEIVPIKQAIEELRLSQLIKLEKFRSELNAVRDTQKTEVELLRSKCIKHQPFYDMLQTIHRLHFTGDSLGGGSFEKNTNYYGLLPSIQPLYEYQLFDAIVSTSNNNNYVSQTRTSEDYNRHSLHSEAKQVSDNLRRPVYIITSGNKNDVFFGEDYIGAPLFLEYDGQFYGILQISSSYNPREIAAQIQQDIERKKQTAV